MADAIAVYGAGGHGKVVADILLAMGLVVECIIDDAPTPADKRVLGLPVYSAVEWLKSHSSDATVALGIGDNAAREKAAERVRNHGGKLVTAIHPEAIVARSVRIGEGAAIMAAAVLNPDCEIGEGAIVNTGAIVEHDVHIGRYVHLSPNCTIAGGAGVGEYSHIGMSANVLPLKRVGAHCTIGASSVVVEDVPDSQVAYGIPAKVRR